MKFEDINSKEGIKQRDKAREVLSKKSFEVFCEKIESLFFSCISGGCDKELIKQNYNKLKSEFMEEKQ